MTLQLKAQGAEKRYFDLPDVRGGHYRLLDRSGQPILIAFVDIAKASRNSPSLREMNFLASMKHQYAPHGLEIVAVDSSGLTSGHPSSRSDLTNISYDWHLTFPLLDDAGGDVARTFDVHDLPTLILLDGSGRMVRTWHGFVPPSMLAQSIESLLGGPLARWPPFESSARQSGK